ncbi:MAG: hypothetical protein WDO13_13455 [Verrucomicrobiota bacterium]
MKKFKSQLPNEGDIEHEVNRFVDLTNRGFIEPTGLFFTGNGDQIQLQGRFANNSTRLNQQPLGQIGRRCRPPLVSQIDASQILRLAGTGPMGGGGMPSGGGGMPSGGGRRRAPHAHRDHRAIGLELQRRPGSAPDPARQRRATSASTTRR